MVWEAWLQSIAPSLNMTATQAGMILSLLFTFFFIMMAAIASPNHADLGIPITGLIFTFFFTYIAWYPIWTGSALALVISIFIGLVLTGRVKIGR